MSPKQRRMVIVIDYHLTKERDGSADLRLPHRIDVVLRRVLDHVIAVDHVGLFTQPQEGELPQI